MFEPDLADRVDDLICIFEGGNPDREMDTISMLLTGWIIFLFSSIALVKFIYIRYVRKDNKKQEALTNEKNASENSVNSLANGRDSVPSNNVQSSTAGQQLTKRSTGLLSFIRGSSTSVESTGFPNTSKGCTGPDPLIVDYINECYSWLYSPSSLSQNANKWELVKDSLVDSLGKILREQGKKEIPIFVSVVDINITNPIQITNLYAECEHTNSIKITCDCEATKLQGVLSLYSTDMGSSSCDFFIDRICGRLNILLDTDEQIANIKFDGWPEICVGIKSSSSSDTKLDSKTSEFLAEKLASAIRSSVLEIEFKKFASFPIPSAAIHLKSKESRKKYLCVKIVRGSDLGISKGCEEPYCAIELDDPPQKFQTERQGISPSDPAWNENFVFNVLPNGGEILFEVYDYVGTRFLGCNIISVDEITNDKMGQRRTLPLKSRRMEITDQISGTLQVQFTFLSENELMQKSKVEPLKGGKGENSLWNGNLKDLEISPNKSTLVIQSRELPNHNNSRAFVKIKRAPDGTIIEVNEDDTQTQKATNQSDNERAALDGTYGEERGRRKTRRGDIFTSIRRRFSKGRSASALPPNVAGDKVEDSANPDLYGRSISADRQIAANNALGLNSTRSSASELSGMSGHSTTTFIHENSTLVIECVENRVKKYYLVPPHLAETGKWKKRGKKLHIYNDHTFVAKRMQSGTPCAVCFGRFQFSLGKQGYQCRDCKLKCHKECHVRTPTFCANTTVYDIELAAVKPIPPTSTTQTKSSTSPFHSFAESCSAFFKSKKEPPSSEVNKTGSASPNEKVSPSDVAKLTSSKKGKTLPTTNISIPPPIGVPTKPKTTRRMNIFKRATKLGKIAESEEVTQLPTAVNSTPPPKSPNTEQQQFQESTVTILMENEEEEDHPEQEITALIQVKCNSIIKTKNIKNYSIE